MIILLDHFQNKNFEMDDPFCCAFDCAVIHGVSIPSFAVN
jgi:hypothetical protein